jgi:ankyrin repeat protein
MNFDFSPDEKILLKDWIGKHNFTKSTFVEYEFDIANLGNSALMTACQEENYEICELLIKKYGTPLYVNLVNDKAKTALIYACETENINIVDLLVKYRADINMYDLRGYTALMIACEKRNFDLCNLLINPHTNVHIKTPKIIYGKHYKSYKSMNLTGADLNQVDCNGFQAFMYASAKGAKGAYDICELLIKHGTNIHKVDNFGNTVLTYTCSKGNIKICELLIRHGADINRIDLYGHTALYYACEREHTKICKLLLKNGATFNIKDLNNKILRSVLEKLGYELRINLN